MRLTEAVPLCLRPASRGWPGVVLLGCFGFSLGTAAPTGDELLRSVDAALNPIVALRLDYVAVTKEDEPGLDHVVRLTLIAQGEKRLYEYIAPPDANGTKLLILGPRQAYVYLPSFGKVRRLTPQSDSEGFLGMMFTPQDLGASRFSTLYTARVTRDDEHGCNLELTPRLGQAAPFARIKMHMMKPEMLPFMLEYYDKDGVKLRTELRQHYETKDPLTTLSQIRITDHRPKGSTTTFYRLDWEILTELPPETFTTKGLIPVPVND